MTVIYTIIWIAMAYFTYRLVKKNFINDNGIGDWDIGSAFIGGLISSLAWPMMLLFMFINWIVTRKFWNKPSKF